MSENRYFGFGEFGTWVRSQIQALTDHLNLKLGEVDQTLQSKADQSTLDLTNQAVANKANQNEVSDALNGKLDVTATAADSAKLGGQTPEYYATVAAVTQLEADVNAMLTDLTEAFNTGADKINSV